MPDCPDCERPLPDTADACDRCGWATPPLVVAPKSYILELPPLASPEEIKQAKALGRDLTEKLAGMVTPGRPRKNHNADDPDAELRDRRRRQLAARYAQGHVCTLACGQGGCEADHRRWRAELVALVEGTRSFKRRNPKRRQR